MAELVSTVIGSALRLLKVKEAGEGPNAEEGVDGLVALNDLIEEWNNQTLMQPAKVQLSQTMVGGQAEYTFGTGGDNTTRPVRIFNAFVRDAGNVDYPIKIISNEAYSLINFKSTSSSYPYNLYYRESYPLGVVSLYPVPVTGNILFLEVQASLATYSDVSDVIDLPQGYLKAIKYNLAVQISPEYKDASPLVMDQAMKSVAWIKRMNNDDKPIMSNSARIATRRRGGWYGWLFGV